MNRSMLGVAAMWLVLTACSTDPGLGSLAAEGDGGGVTVTWDYGVDSNGVQRTCADLGPNVDVGVGVGPEIGGWYTAEGGLCDVQSFWDGYAVDANGRYVVEVTADRISDDGGWVRLGSVSTWVYVTHGEVTDAGHLTLQID